MPSCVLSILVAAFRAAVDVRGTFSDLPGLGNRSVSKFSGGHNTVVHNDSTSCSNIYAKLGRDLYDLRTLVHKAGAQFTAFRPKYVGSTARMSKGGQVDGSLSQLYANERTAVCYY